MQKNAVKSNFNHVVVVHDNNNDDGAQNRPYMLYIHGPRAPLEYFYDSFGYGRNDDDDDDDGRKQALANQRKKKSMKVAIELFLLCLFHDKNT